MTISEDSTKHTPIDHVDPNLLHMVRPKATGLEFIIESKGLSKSSSIKKFK